jgi:hypothetical protein
VAASSVRDAAVTAFILGFFAISWFGWGQEDPPVRWRPRLIAGSVVAAVVALAGGVLAVRHWSGASAIHAPGAGRHYGIIVGVEFAVAGIGAGVLGARGLARWIAPWVAFVVGVHFWPMAPVLADPWLVPLGVALVVAAALGVRSGRAGAAPSAVTGAVSGVALLVSAVGHLAAAL